MNSAPAPAGAFTRPALPSSALVVATVIAVAALGFRARAGSVKPQSAPVPAIAGRRLAEATEPLPERLSDTGLYVAGSVTEVAPENLFYVPQYPLWSDGAAKRRWVSIPRGTRIDASDPDDWTFPVGTRFWKEFRFGGGRVETRYMKRSVDGTYRYATYVWDAARGDAFRAPDAGARGVAEIRPGVLHDVPSLDDCRACHEGRRTPVLGFGALQLSADRDPLAPHREPVPSEAVDLEGFARRGLLDHVPEALLVRAPRIDAPTPRARAAAGYLFGNCSGCHNASGPLASVGLDFNQSVVDPHGYERVLDATVDRSSRFRLPGESTSVRVSAGRPDRSAVAFRMHSRAPASQMPPLGTKLVDAEGARAVELWISSDTRHARRKPGK